MQDQDAFDLAVQVWQEGATVATVNGAGPMGFYDIKSQKMAIYNDTAQAILRNGSALMYGTDIATSLLSLSQLILDDHQGGAGIRDGLSETAPKVINFKILLKPL